MTELQIPVAIAERTLNLIWIVDCYGSMAGQKMRDLMGSSERSDRYWKQLWEVIRMSICKSVASNFQAKPSGISNQPIWKILLGKTSNQMGSTTTDEAIDLLCEPCPSCNQNLTVKDEHAGRTLKCSVCQINVMVPSDDAPLSIGEPVPPESTTSESAQQPVTVESDLSPSLESTEQGENHPEPKQSVEVIQDSVEQPDTFEPSVSNELPASVPEPTRDVVERILSELQPILAKLNEKVESLTKEAEFWKQLVTKKQEQIDKLYDENQEHKQGILEKFKKSLVLAVIGQIDSAFKTISHFGNQEFSEENYCKLLENYSEIATDFQDSLAQSFDVAAFNSEKDTPFDAKRQRALKTAPTEEETKHKTISKSLSHGYEIVNADGTKTLLRLEMVEVYVHQSTPTP
ncbi:MAG: nucleotide exchange factor GrpE [Planctomycetaceae bacterium]|jgi:molecular chaperone GrpE (heat shock protein)|nr:nucleotide exchange factor GrpE [Planctomycetaceae bacterium]